MSFFFQNQSSIKLQFINEFVKKLKTIETKFKLPIIIVVDSGELFDHYHNIFLQNDFIILNDIQKLCYLF